MHTLVALASAALWLGTAGCAGVALEPAERAPTRTLTAPTLVDKVWTLKPGLYSLRQAALFEFGDVKVAADGLLRLDLANGNARLVAVNEMGVKLFDMTVTRETVVENFVLPDLAKAPGLSASVATCLRAVYLGYHPRATDRLTTAPDRYELVRKDSEGQLTCTFSGLETLLGKDYAGKGQSWTVRFLDYRAIDGAWVSGRTVFSDRQAGYRVSLWLNEWKEVHA